jgi:signal transduction histidine kinase/CheY-like chemotaxis protein
MCEYVRRLLAPRFEVEAVPDGKAALDSAQRRRPAMVVTDAAMPGLDGFGLLKQLRADARLRAVPVILLTARAGEESMLEGLEAGADDYLVKPFSARELLARVTRSLRLVREREEAEHERTARAAAERAAHRSAFLAKAGVLLSESLDYEETLGRLGRLCVQELADVCVLDIVEGGEINRLPAACADPAKEPLLERLRSRHPAHWASPHPAARCLRDGQPISVPEFTDDLLRSMCDDEEHVELIRAIGVRSLVAVPLVARGQKLGVLSLGSGAPGRYSQADLELAQEVAERAAIAIDNARLYRETQRAVRMRDEFLVVASHELRTPVTSLNLSLRTLAEARRSGRQAESETMRELLEIAERQGIRLVRLVNHLLDDVERGEFGGLALSLSEIDLGALVRDVVQRFRAEASRAGCPLWIRCDVPVVARCDPSRIDQVVTNLLSNAIKFGARKPIEITLGQEDGMVRLTVRDHGIGIDPSHQARIFERFERAAPVQHYSGLGLGLYVSRGIVEAHGGVLRVESGLGTGSAFTMELPRGGPEGDGPPA